MTPAPPRPALARRGAKAVRRPPPMTIVHALAVLVPALAHAGFALWWLGRE